MKEKYVILKSTPQAKARVSLFGDFSSKSKIKDQLLMDFQVEEDEIASNRIIDIAKHKDVIAVAPELPMKLIKPVGSSLSKDESSECAWGIHAVGADTSPYTGDKVVVSVIDTGIDVSHVAFKGVELIEKDFTDEGNGDANGHGTHCAGIIFGRDINGFRIGIATGVKKALIGKVLGKDGGGSNIKISQAIRWALDNGANIISMSLVMDFPGYVDYLIKDEGLPPAIATSKGLVAYRTNVKLFEALAMLVRSSAPFSQPAIMVAAAGNESRRDENPNWVVDVAPPAVSEGIISVSALSRNGEVFDIASFSNRGANISGPGEHITSAKHGGGKISMSGTSMAAPHVVGVAAQFAEMLMKSGEFSPFQLTAKILGTATIKSLKIGYDSYDVGLGLVQSPQ